MAGVSSYFNQEKIELYALMWINKPINMRERSPYSNIGGSGIQIVNWDIIKSAASFIRI